MRQRLSPKNVQRLRHATGLPIVAVTVRGDTDHRRDLYLTGGTIMHLYKDGTLARADWGWRDETTAAPRVEEAP